MHAAERPSSGERGESQRCTSGNPCSYQKVLPTALPSHTSIDQPGSIVCFSLISRYITMHHVSHYLHIYGRGECTFDKYIPEYSRISESYFTTQMYTLQIEIHLARWFSTWVACLLQGTWHSRLSGQIRRRTPSPRGHLRLGI